MAANETVMLHSNNKCSIQSSKDICEKLLEDIDRTLDITRIAEEDFILDGENILLENEHFSPTVVNLERFRFRERTPDSPADIECIDVDTPPGEKKDEANVKDFFRKQILFYQRELKNKQKVIESLLLLLHENSKIITRDEQKSPSQELNTFVKNSIATQTNETIISTIKDNSNQLNFSGIDQVSDNRTTETIISTMQDDSNRLNFSGIELLNKTESDNRCIDEQFTFIRQLQKSKYDNFKTNQRNDLKRRLEKLANYNIKESFDERNTNSKHKGNTVLTDAENQETESSNSSTEETTVNPIDPPAKKRIHIAGDSMIKHLNERKVCETTKSNVKITCYRGAKIADLEKRLRQTIANENPDDVIIHIGTNDLGSNQSAEEIAKSIVSLGMSYADSTHITVSEIITRDDYLNHKAKAVNKILYKMCSERNIAYISHNNINKIHLNGSKLHLNKNGTKMLSKNLCKTIGKF